MVAFCLRRFLLLFIVYLSSVGAVNCQFNKLNLFKKNKDLNKENSKQNTKTYSTSILEGHQEKIDSINNYLYELVINYRLENGKSHLKIDKSEESSCLNHCNYMIAETNIQDSRGFLSHKENNKNNPYYTGYEFRDRDKTNKFSGGENIIYAPFKYTEFHSISNYKIALVIFKSWKESKIHNMNMLYDSHNSISSAISIGKQSFQLNNRENTVYLIYGTQTFYK